MKLFQGYQLIIFEWFLFSLSVPFVAIRVYIQFYYRRRAYREVFTILALLAYLAVTISDTVNYANGFHDDDFDFYANTPQVITILKMYALAMFCYMTSIYFAKFVMLLFYMDLMPRNLYPKTWWLIVSTWICCVFSWLYSILVTFGLCRPFSLFWTPPDDEFSEYCWSVEWYFVSSWVLHVLAEIMVYSIPFVILRHLKSMRSNEKKAAYAMFAAGGVNVACSLMMGALNSIPPEADIHWDLWSAVYWFLNPIFTGTSLIIICLPQVRRLWLMWTSPPDDEEIREYSRRKPSARDTDDRVDSVALKGMGCQCNGENFSTTVTSGTIDIRLSLSLEPGWWQPNAEGMDPEYRAVDGRAYEHGVK